MERLESRKDTTTYRSENCSALVVHARKKFVLHFVLKEERREDEAAAAVSPYVLGGAKGLAVAWEERSA